MSSRDTQIAIREARLDDVPGILQIYNQVVVSSVEHSVHVRSDRRGTGIGRKLVEAILPYALALDKHVMIGAIDASNDTSIKFHARLGFREVAHFREVGFKFGRWLDLVFMQRILDARQRPHDLS